MEVWIYHPVHFINVMDVLDAAFDMLSFPMSSSQTIIVLMTENWQKSTAWIICRWFLWISYDDEQACDVDPGWKIKINVVLMERIVC